MHQERPACPEVPRPPDPWHPSHPAAPAAPVATLRANRTRRTTEPAAPTAPGLRPAAPDPSHRLRPRSAPGDRQDLAALQDLAAPRDRHPSPLLHHPSPSLRRTRRARDRDSPGNGEEIGPSSTGLREAHDDFRVAQLQIFIRIRFTENRPRLLSEVETAQRTVSFPDRRSADKTTSLLKRLKSSKRVERPGSRAPAALRASYHVRPACDAHDYHR